MNAPMTKFAIMRANRKKQEQVAAYGRLMDKIGADALGYREDAPGSGVRLTARQAASMKHPLLGGLKW